MKGISTVVAVLLMLIIVIALVGLSYGYVSGAFYGKTATAFSIVDSFENTLTIRNDGTENITSFSVMTVDGNQANYLVFVPDSNLVGHWRFDEGNGLIASDSSGNGNDGRLANGPVWVNCEFGSCLNFDGSDDYVNVPDHPSLNIVGPITISAWVKVAPSISPDFRARIVSDLKYFGGADHGYLFYISKLGDSDDGKVAAVIEGGIGKTRGPVTGTTLVNDNSWHFAVFTWDSTGARIYVDGIPEGTNTALTDPPDTTTADTEMSSSGTQTFNGAIDEVKIYNRALSADEVKSLYNIGSQIPSGRTATILIYNQLSTGTHTVRMCTKSVCNTALLRIS